jgi:hypothetical protein
MTQPDFILLPSIQTQYTFVTLYNETGIVKSVFITCFGLIGHHQMYSQLHNETNFFVKILYIRYLVKRVGCNPYYCTFNG